MTTTEVTDYLNPLAFMSIGTVLGAVVNKTFTEKDKNNLYWIFYIFSAVVITFLIYTAIATKWDVLNFAWWLTLISNIGLVLVTFFFLKTRNIYKTAELDPIINRFTDKAEKNFINLLCGDINFFGTTPKEMDLNSQYTHLRAAGFKEINIMCFPPNDNTDKIRYGKLIHDMPSVKIKYYQPSKANLSLRGRIARFQGGPKLLMYSKISPRTYKAIETHTGDSDGALYNNIWELIWGLGEVPSEADIKHFIELSQQ